MEHFDALDIPALQTLLPAVESVGGTSRAMREDATIFFGRQLEYVRTQVYERPVAPIRAFDMIPVTSETPAWAESVVTQTFDQVGIAKIISNYADDLPRADVKASETTTRVKDLGDSYGYNVSELRMSEATGANLPTRKANAARRAIEIKTAQIAMIGEPLYQLYGLLTHPNIGVTTGLTGTWATATAEQILADLNLVVGGVSTQSKQIHQVNFVAMPIASEALTRTKYLLNSGGKTVAQAFRENNPGVQIVAVAELAGAGTAGANVMIAAEKDSNNFSFELVLPFNQLPAQARNLELVVPCVARVAGLQVYYPLSITRAEGI